LPIILTINIYFFNQQHLFYQDSPVAKKNIAKKALAAGLFAV